MKSPPSTLIPWAALFGVGGSFKRKEWNVTLYRPYSYLIIYCVIKQLWMVYSSIWLMENYLLPLPNYLAYIYLFIYLYLTFNLDCGRHEAKKMEYRKCFLRFWWSFATEVNKRSPELFL